MTLSFQHDNLKKHSTFCIFTTTTNSIIWNDRILVGVFSFRKDIMNVVSQHTQSLGENVCADLDAKCNIGHLLYFALVAIPFRVGTMHFVLLEPLYVICALYFRGMCKCTDSGRSQSPGSGPVFKDCLRVSTLPYSFITLLILKPISNHIIYGLNYLTGFF